MYAGLPSRPSSRTTLHCQRESFRDGETAYSNALIQCCAKASSDPICPCQNLKSFCICQWPGLTKRSKDSHNQGCRASSQDLHPSVRRVCWSSKVDRLHRCRPSIEARVPAPGTLWQPEGQTALMACHSTTTGLATNNAPKAEMSLTPTGTLPDGDRVLNASTAFRM